MDAIKQIEAALHKVEDGVEYPGEAYAFVPDDNPETWDLRMWESGKVDKRLLDKCSAYLSPGGYNGDRIIIDESDLPEIQQRIRQGYSDIGMSEVPRWVKGNEERVGLTEFIPLTEAAISEKGEANVIVIKHGFNTSKKRFYKKETLARDFNMFEGAKMYANHQTDEEELARPEGDVRQWVGNLMNVRVNEEGHMVGNSVINAPWLKEKLKILQEKGLLSEMGVSIRAAGKAVEGVIEGTKTHIVEGITRVKSVDFVTEPGAGGRVLLYEDDQSNDVDLINLEALKERRPDLVEAITSETRNIIRREIKMSEELQAKVVELETQVETVTKERDESLEKVKEAETEKAKATAQAVITTAIAEADLPAPAKARLTARFTDATSDEGLAEAIQAEKDYIAELGDLGKVKGMGESTPNTEAVQEAAIGKLREAVKVSHPNFTEAQIDKYIAAR
jgi:hypothetical protein